MQDTTRKKTRRRVPLRALVRMTVIAAKPQSADSEDAVLARALSQEPRLGQIMENWCRNHSFCLGDKLTKNREEALSAKERGTKAFVSGCYTTALYEYQHCVRHAVTTRDAGTAMPLSTAYANRSAALFALADATKLPDPSEMLVDVIGVGTRHILLEAAKHDVLRALGSGYPKETACKLHLRYARCLQEQDVASLLRMEGVSRDVLLKASLENLRQTEAAFADALDSVNDMATEQEQTHWREKVMRAQSAWHKKNTHVSPQQLRQLMAMGRVRKQLEERAQPERRSTPRLSEHVELHRDDTQGRFARAAHNLAAGTELLNESAFMWTLHPDVKGVVCEACLQDLDVDFVPCTRCPDAFYCSKRCRIVARTLFHGRECGRAWAVDIEDDILLAIRMMFALERERERASKRAASASPAGHSDPLAAWPGVHEIEDNAAQLPLVDLYTFKLMTHILSQALDLTPEQRVLLTRCQMQVQFNSLLSRRMATGSRMTVFSLTGIKDRFELTNGPPPNDEIQEIVVCRAIYRCLSMFNHSCMPNTLGGCDTAEMDMSTKVRQKISKLGQESQEYRDHASHATDQLYRAWASSNDSIGSGSTIISYADVLRVGNTGDEDAHSADFVCPNKCDATLLATEHTCKKCGHAVDLEARKKMEDEIATLLSQPNIETDVDTLCKNLELHSKLYSSSSLKLGEAHDRLARAYHSQGKLELAAKHCSISLQIVTHVFGGESPETARELFKQVTLVTAAYPHSAATRTLQSLALRLHLKMFGEDHPTTRAIKELIHST
ncbi:hypothetical protein THASP1DRAFT_28362 [Thamnocephalis sphaerospora]|uniref:MYND-type domain-containing protein n=1 Tax=Thamnocephalis sphaerospora TaxID=78915 RepID=A0A4V1IX52_9FUNG|nr:hypothetical protein THASP1DRAFT_28362 [Thamnocephalis sphaerospora]|eukprot:RKP09849.1 hypothetical protein THASP1DRAFT_28362 [Thamnocephalis sphaerospora]